MASARPWYLARLDDRRPEDHAEAPVADDSLGVVGYRVRPVGPSDLSATSYVGGGRGGGGGGRGRTGARGSAVGRGAARLAPARSAHRERSWASQTKYRPPEIRYLFFYFSASPVTWRLL